MATLAIIGGTGAAFFPRDATTSDVYPMTTWGEPSAPLQTWQQHGHSVLFLSRHGLAGDIAPHRVNYRANVQLLRDCGADAVVALNAVGGIARDAWPGRLVIADQLIDYSWGREHTYYDRPEMGLEFSDFTEPYDRKLRESLVSVATDLGLDPRGNGTYGVTQGPRLETSAEINRLEQDGCHIVGMTSMPEAALARELGLPYANCSIVVNWAAGRSSAGIHAEIAAHLQQGMAQAAELLDTLLATAEF
jgi:purine nucleoside phosphorylase